MKAIILAAGRGSRMKRLTEDRPKCLIELKGKALLDWQIEALHAAGIKEVSIVTGYRRELLVKRELFEFHNTHWAETNMVSSLACAEAWLESGPCIVSYSDIFYEASAVRSLMACPAKLAVTYDPKWLELWSKRFCDPLIDAETFRLECGKQKLADIGGKPKSIEEIQGQYMGLLRFTPEGWKEINSIRATMTNEERDRMHMTGALKLVIGAGNIAIAAVPYTHAWGEIDTESDLEIYK